MTVWMAMQQQIRIFAIVFQSFLLEMEVLSMEKRQSRRADIMGHPMEKCQTPCGRTSFS